MGKIEKNLTILIFGAVLPIFFFLAGWWGSIGRVSDDLIFSIAFIGLGMGIILDILFLKKWLVNVYGIDTKLLAVIYLFFSTCTFGFFMGVPVFNLLVGMMAGFFAGRKSYHKKENRFKAKANIREVSIFTAVVMLLTCISSAFFALRDTMDTARNLEGMLHLGAFSLTTSMLIGIIVIGGIVLVSVQYWLTKKAAIIAYSKKER